MSDRRTVSGAADVIDRLEDDHKHDEDTWTDVLRRAADALDKQTDGRQVVRKMNADGALTEDHIDDIVSRTARRAAEEVENRLTRR